VSIATNAESSVSTEDILRREAPQVLSALTRRYGHFDLCEDAVQEALLAASTQWPAGIPDSPRGWLLTVASRRLTDQLRAESARLRREAAVVSADPLVAPPADDERPADHDDTLTLLFLCCHPSLSAPSQVALTLRAVGGLTTAEIARAFFVPETTMGQRISRAKQRLRDTGFGLPPGAEWATRLGAVLHVLYLIFNEGYATTSGPALHRPDLTREAIRLTRGVHQMLPDDGEVAGLLALMLLNAAIAEGVSLVSSALSAAPLGPYQVQAAIAAVHAEAPTAQDTDWPQIVKLYEVLLRIAPNPMAALSHAVAVAMVDGPAAGLELVDHLDDPARTAVGHRRDAVRAHLLDLAGDAGAARAAYLAAARGTTSLPEQRYLRARAARAAAP
jgi:RNA polymerase sigma factor (sigma-70 family)